MDKWLKDSCSEMNAGLKIMPKFNTNGKTHSRVILLTPVEAVHQPHHGVKNNEKLISYDKKSALPPNE